MIFITKEKDERKVEGWEIGGLRCMVREKERERGGGGRGGEREGGEREGGREGGERERGGGRGREGSRRKGKEWYVLEPSLRAPAFAKTNATYQATPY